MPPATGQPLFCEKLPQCSLVVGLNGSQNLIESDGSETLGVIGQAIRDDQLALVEESAASINDVGHISFPFVLINLEQGLAKTAENLAGSD